MASRPTLVVTRPQPQATTWAQGLEALGQPCVALPLLDIQPPEGARAEQAVQEAWQRIDGGEVELVMFVSPAAVDAFWSAKAATQHWPATAWAAAPGPGTARALEPLLPRGLAQVYRPADDAEQFDSDTLWDALAGRAWQGQRILIVHGGKGRETLARRWEAAGATVSTVQAYRRDDAAWDGERRACLEAVLRDPDLHVWLFGSSQAVERLPTLAPRAQWSLHCAVCTHPTIATAAQAVGFGKVRTVVPRLEAVVSACREPWDRA
jgi:uroporphyrinogen-III synthase